jgi:hypothetical protein
MAGGSASALSLSRPAQASLTLWPAGSLSRPQATFVTRLQPAQLPARAARQLPDQSTTLRVDSSSTDDPRLRGALPSVDMVASPNYRTQNSWSKHRGGQVLQGAGASLDEVYRTCPSLMAIRLRHAQADRQVRTACERHLVICRLAPPHLVIVTRFESTADGKPPTDGRRQ